jgi:histidine triad (HIT) family protein
MQFHVQASCIFCKIAQHTAPARVAFEDDVLVAFHDIRPVAPVHLLICPKDHIGTLNDLTPENDALLGRIFQTAKNLAKQLGVDQKGYRTVFNVNADAGQTVFHLHLHLIGGRALNWP